MICIVKIYYIESPVSLYLPPEVNNGIRHKSVMNHRPSCTQDQAGGSDGGRWQGTPWISCQLDTGLT